MFDPNQVPAAFAGLVQGEPVPQVEEAARLRSEALAAYKAQAYDKAVELLAAYARQADLLARVMKSCLAPARSLGEEEAEQLNLNLQVLGELEQDADELLRDRNRALLYRAECLAQLGRTAEALGGYGAALEVLGTAELDSWQTAANEVLALIGRKPLRLTRRRGLFG